MKNKKEIIYTGELAKPMQEYTLPFEDGFKLGPIGKEIIKNSLDEEMHKLMLLVKHFEIDVRDENPWLLLSLALARTHVPGFKKIKKAGTPQIWHWARLCELRKAVDGYIEITPSKISVTQACIDLAKNEPWKSLLADKRRPEEVLRTQYYNIKPEDCKMSEESLNEVLQEYEKRKNNVKS